MPTHRTARLVIAAAALAAASPALAQDYTLRLVPQPIYGGISHVLRNDGTVLTQDGENVYRATPATTENPGGILYTLAASDWVSPNQITYTAPGAARNGHSAYLRTVTQIVEIPGWPFPYETVVDCRFEIGHDLYHPVAFSRGDLIPGLPFGAVWECGSSLIDGQVLMTPTGDAVFRNGTHDAIFRVRRATSQSPPTVQVVARAAQISQTTWYYNMYADAVNAAGDVLVRHRTTTLLGESWGLRIYPASGPSISVAFGGGIAPGGGAFSAILPSTPASMNDAGQVLFIAHASGADPSLDGDGLWLFTPDAGLQAVVRRGQPAPGIPGATFRGAYPGINNNGTCIIAADGAIAFLARLEGPGITSANDAALYFRAAAPGSPLTLVAREGDPTPGVEGAFDSLVDWFYAGLDLDPAGNLYFTASFRTPANTAGTGMWLRPASGAPVRKILATGDTVAAGGVTRTVTAVEGPRSSSGHQDGRPAWVTDTGEILLGVRFPNRAIFLAVPAPPARCPADWNDDGAINSNDISAFLSSWLDAVQNSLPTADFNADGHVNSNDISAFLAAWLQAVQHGC